VSFEHSKHYFGDSEDVNAEWKLKWFTTILYAIYLPVISTYEMLF